MLKSLRLLRVSGRLEISIFEYGCFGSLSTDRAGPISTIFPPYMIPILDANCAISPMS